MGGDRGLSKNKKGEAIILIFDTVSLPNIRCY